MTLILGSLGSMGRRYQAILKHLGVDFGCFDVHPEEPDYDSFDNFIVATPTNTHLGLIKHLSQYKKPILCEKPLAIETSEFLEILKTDVPISMMMQYRFFDRDYASGDSIYDYYNHGKDGIVWDCFQIIALARGDILLKESSPVWRCVLNGQELDLSRMDMAYIWAVREFLNGKYISKQTLLEYHNKVRNYGELQNGIYSNSGQVHVY